MNQISPIDGSSYWWIKDHPHLLSRVSWYESLSPVIIKSKPISVYSFMFLYIIQLHTVNLQTGFLTIRNVLSLTRFFCSCFISVEVETSLLFISTFSGGRFIIRMSGWVLEKNIFHQHFLPAGKKLWDLKRGLTLLPHSFSSKNSINTECPVLYMTQYRSVP